MSYSEHYTCTFLGFGDWGVQKLSQRFRKQHRVLYTLFVSKYMHEILVRFKKLSTFTGFLPLRAELALWLTCQVLDIPC